MRNRQKNGVMLLPMTIVDLSKLPILFVPTGGDGCLSVHFSEDKDGTSRGTIGCRRDEDDDNDKSTKKTETTIKIHSNYLWIGDPCYLDDGDDNARLKI